MLSDERLYELRVSGAQELSEAEELLNDARITRALLAEATARADAADLRAEALLRRVAALRAALPDPGALLLLADWLDATDRPGQGNEVQTDLRRWADAAARTLGGPSYAHRNGGEMTSLDHVGRLNDRIEELERLNAQANQRAMYRQRQVADLEAQVAALRELRVDVDEFLQRRHGYQVHMNQDTCTCHSCQAWRLRVRFRDILGEAV